ncbi:MAG: hypothetical protein IJX89_00705 [Alphaproteobacteria bacterium]|nr:hypothetical protein [Alphaproteobacteria bacterium]
MPNEREIYIAPLTATEYNISGNVFRAYYDADDKLVFILDSTDAPQKPNVLLVINPVGDRKWDDILMNDYGVDLETVRPKKDNKYQKMDIEYAGLAEYDNLIGAYNNGADLAGALAELESFKNAAAIRAANERKSAAIDTISKARTTIEKTNETISELQARLKTLRTRLGAQRREIGKEPTKQSAAKILRTESQIDATNAKLVRARKRLENAQHRLAAAEEEIDVADAILAMLKKDSENLPVRMVRNDIAPVDPAPVPMATAPQFTEIIPAQPNEPKADDMADDEVKPLFDKDPEILDEEIAFKPIEFDAPAPVQPTPVAPIADVYSEPAPVQPLSFSPPTSTAPVSDFAPIDAPVLDTITTVDAPVTAETFVPTPIVDEVPAPHPIPQNAPAPVAPVSTVPDVAPAPISSDFRPVSPISGTSVAPAAPVQQRKPAMIYYVLLIVLIALSIFTLWLYQKSTNDTVPELGAKTQPVATTEAPTSVADTTTAEAPTPFIEAAPVAETVSVESPTAPAVEPEPVEPEVVVGEIESIPVTPANDDIQVAQAVVETVPVTPAVAEETPVAVIPTVPTVSPFLDEEPVVIPSEEEILASKPTYNVSQQEKMFVADTEYETDTPTVVSAEETVITEEVDTCADGNAPDMDGCCTGETLTDMGDGTFACCAESNGECFPPMI